LIVGACVVLGLIAVENLTGEKKESPTATVVDEAALQQERDKAEAAAAQAREAEQRAARAEQEAAAKAEKEKRSMASSKAGEEQDFEIAPGVKITMCWIPPGEFMMGSPKDEQGRNNDENQYQVTHTQGFWLAKTEVTQAQWKAVMGNNPSHFKGDDLPVESVSWNDIAGPGGFIDKVNQTAAAAGGRFHLPTEAQWEYACRAGTPGPYAGDLDQMAWYERNSGGKAHPMGQKQANAWGLHDMHGNVWEWCADWYGTYPSATKTDPQRAASGSIRVLRGGSWFDYAVSCRSAFRNSYFPGLTSFSVGFRPARSSVP